MKRIYLDHNATTPVDPEVLEAMLPFYKESFGNASSVHEFGRTARMGVEDAREIVYKFLGTHDSQEIVFTSGGTESDNLAVKGVAHALKSKGNHIITSSIEHHAVFNPCKFLEGEGFKVTYLPVDEFGVVDLNALKDAVTDKTILVSIMMANNEVGTIEPIEEISKIVKSKGIVFHTDAVQGVGKIPVNVDKLGVDLLSLSGHKIYGPKGIGALYIRRGVKLTPILQGGHHERKRRPGTENVPGIVGLGKAVELVGKNLKKEPEKLKRLRDRLHYGIEKTIKFTKLNGHPTKRLPNTLNISFEYLEGESILLNLDMEGVAASTGSACTSGSLETSHVLISMHVDTAIAQGSIRFSLGKENTEEEIDYVIKVLPPIIERLRKMSPLYHGKQGVN
ncbi:MAG: cysteine desulfurase NifS [Candidatus Omnitrophica bacterium]|nr:cysteine desulfurase NifS [Candidatus Omnitrophota bacterium]